MQIAAINFTHTTNTLADMTVFCPLLQEQLLDFINKYQCDHWYI